jgi:hypothetical protein
MGRVTPSLDIDRRLSEIEVAVLTPNAIAPTGWNQGGKLAPLIPDILRQHRRSGDSTVGIATNAGVQAREFVRWLSERRTIITPALAGCIESDYGRFSREVQQLAPTEANLDAIDAISRAYQYVLSAEHDSTAGVDRTARMLNGLVQSPEVRTKYKREPKYRPELNDVQGLALALTYAERGYPAALFTRHRCIRILTSIGQKNFSHRKPVTIAPSIFLDTNQGAAYQLLEPVYHAKHAVNSQTEQEHENRSG